VGSKALFRDGSALDRKAWDERRWFYSCWDKGCERHSRVPSYPVICGCTRLGRDALHRSRCSEAALGYKKGHLRRARTVENEFLVDDAHLAKASCVPDIALAFVFGPDGKIGRGLRGLDTIDPKTDTPLRGTSQAGRADLAAHGSTSDQAGFGNVEFPGHVTGMARGRHSRMPMPTCSSWTGGLPISVLEAMAPGLPCSVRCRRPARFFSSRKMDFSPDRREPGSARVHESGWILNPGLCSSIARFNRNYARDIF